MTRLKPGAAPEAGSRVWEFLKITLIAATLGGLAYGAIRLMMVVFHAFGLTI